MITNGATPMKENSMLHKSYALKNVGLLICMLASLLVIALVIAHFSKKVIPNVNSSDLESSSSGSPVTLQTNINFNPFKYLPAGAKINNRDKDIIFADLDGDGQREVVIFYTIGQDPHDHRASILVLNSSGIDYVKLWEDANNISWGFADPTGVFDLNGSGRPQIVAYRTVGASCPGILDIYQYQSGTIENINGDWTGTCQSELEMKDLDANGTRQIIFRTLKYGVNPDIYRWDGKRYVRSNDRYPQYYNTELEKLLRAINSRELLPASARTMWTAQIVQIYIIQRHYTEAIHLCQEVLRMIDDASLTQPDLMKAEAKSRVFRLLGDVYKAAGDWWQARRHYNKAQRLEAEAKQKTLAVPR